jgi:hypothetical protein
MILLHFFVETLSVDPEKFLFVSGLHRLAVRQERLLLVRL